MPTDLSMRILSVVLILALPVLGCNSNSTPAVASKTSPLQSSESSAEPSTIVKRAEFENWNQFPVGTTVTRSRDVSNGDEKVNQVTIYRLASKDDKRVVVESTVILTRNGQTQTNEPTELEYAATFRLPANMTAEQFSLPPQAKLSGTEPIEVLGQTYEAAIYKWQSSAEAGPVENTMWMSNEVPGRSIKHQTNCAGTITEETITKLELPKSTINS